MVIIRYDDKSKYEVPQWFVTTLKKYHGDSYRHFVNDDRGQDYFGIAGWYDMPTVSELKKNGTVETSMPDELKSHIFRVIFTYVHNSVGFLAITNLLGIKG